MHSMFSAALSAGAALAGLLAIIYTSGLWSKSAPLTPYSLLVGPDVYRRPGFFQTVPGRNTPTSTFLVRQGHDFVLLDAGSPGPDHTADLVRAVHAAVGDGNLRLLLLTHGHIDHVGALPALLRAFPSLQVVLHDTEEPYVAGGRPYTEVPSREVSYQLLFGCCLAHNVSSSLTPGQILVLHGSKGDLASAKGLSGEQPTWPVPEGILLWHHAPGHSPGQVAYIHKPSGTMFSGDAIESFMPGKNGEPTLHIPPPCLNANTTQAMESAMELANAAFSRLFPVHDVTGRGFAKEEAIALARGLQEAGAEQRWRAIFQ